MANDLPVAVTNVPHWRVNFRPGQYREDLIGSLEEAFHVIEQTKVSLRGWDYPHLSRRDTERSFGNNWIASWSDFGGHLEYWRLYQSGQFLHLFSVRESTETAWRQKLENDTKMHLRHMRDVDWQTVPGFISIINFLYTVTEIFEFAARLCARRIYQGELTITVELKGVRAFVLTTDWDRAWHSYCAATEDKLGRSWSVRSDLLLSESSEHSLKAVVWFFERFGWLKPSVDVLRKDQQQFLKRRA